MQLFQKVIGLFSFRLIVFILASVILFSCGNETETADAVVAPAESDSIISSETEDDMVEEYGNFFVVIADTGFDYYTLHQLMVELNKATGIEIDTMGRYFNKEKNLIALPDDDEDEMYAGDYFPRRFPSHVLSLEYLNQYMPSGDKTIGLIVGILETEQEADSIMSILKPGVPEIFRVQSEIYLGCMH